MAAPSNVAITIAATLLACTAPGRIEVRISPADIQREIAKSFPIERDLYVAVVQMVEPEIYVRWTA